MRSLAALVLAIAVGTNQAAELDAKFIRETVTPALASWKVPGAVVAVVQGDRAFVAGYGVRTIGSTEPQSANAILPLASCTKAVTVALLASLVDEGKLSWDDPVRKHFPEFRVSDPNVDALITVRDLVSHRSGIKGHDLLWYHAPWNRDEVLKRIENLLVERPFRGSYEYSTILFMAAGKVAENAGGKPWADLVRERITGPLGMDSISFSTADPKFRKSELMIGHRRSKDGRISVVPPYQTEEPNAAGSIHLAARDLVPWLRFQLARGVHGGKRIISEKNFDEMRRPLNPLSMDANLQAFNPDTVQVSYAMGWLVYDYRGRPVVAHGGMIDGYRVQVTVYPKDNLAVAIVCNVQESKVSQAITNSLADRAMDLPPKDWNAILFDAAKREIDGKAAEWNAIVKSRRANVPPSVPLKELVGRYVDPAYGEAEVALEKGKLIWKWSSFTVELEHWEGDVFRLASGFLEDRFLGFRIGKDGPESLQFEGQTFQKK